jgi:hypothetical protein
MQGRIQWSSIFKILKENTYDPRIAYPAKSKVFCVSKPKVKTVYSRRTKTERIYPSQIFTTKDVKSPSWRWKREMGINTRKEDASGKDLHEQMRTIGFVA